jgi:hypothetical protein
MQFMRHADFAVTMEIYTKVSSKATRDALTTLGERLDGCFCVSQSLDGVAAGRLASAE